MVASSLRGIKKSWVKQAGFLWVLAMNLWSCHELLLTGFVLTLPLSILDWLCISFRISLHHIDISVELLIESSSYFGCNPCQCLYAFNSTTTFEENKDSVKLGLKDIPKGTNIFQLLFPSELVLANVSHTLFKLSSTHETRSLYKCQQGPVSWWALDLFLKEFERHKRNFVAILYKRLASLSGAQTLCGHMFERQVSNHPDAINNHHKFSIRSLTTSIEMEWLYRGPIQHFTFQTSTIIKAIKDTFTCQNSIHLVPSNLNFPTVDSILYDPDSEVLTCIQVMIHDKHDIKVSGLQCIQRWLKLHTPLADLSDVGQCYAWHERVLFFSDVDCNNLSICLECKWLVQHFHYLNKYIWAQFCDQQAFIPHWMLQGSNQVQKVLKPDCGQFSL